MTKRHLLTIAQGAEYAHVSTRTVRRYIAQGRLAAFRVGPRLVRIDADELEALLRPIPTAGSAA